MNWIGLLVFLAAIVVMVLLRRAGQISAGVAHELLRNGSPVIDVRTQGEFASRHLPNAINIPLDKIKIALPALYPDRDKAILLHCASGARSGMAQKQLRAIGYTKAFNLGSYARAKKILSGA